MARMSVHIVSAEASLYASDDISFLVAPAAHGEIGILPNHAPLLAQLNAGEVRLTNSDGEVLPSVYVSGGFLEVAPDGVMILADVAMRGDAMDAERIKASQAEAEAAMAKAGSEVDMAKAETALQKSKAEEELLRMYQQLKKA